MKRILLALALVSVSSLAIAEESVPIGATDCAKVRKKDPKARCKDLAIDPEDVDGTHVKPMGELLGGRIQPKWGSMIPLRLSMVDRIVKSADGVK